MAALLALCGLLVAAHLQHSHASALSAAPSPGFTLHDTANQEYAVPEGLLIGAGTSALQTEGAVSEGGRGESNVDHVLHDGKIFPGGPQHYHDTAADSYHRYKEDVAMAVALKLKLFRFSFSWTRLLPTANASEPNLEGVKHYHDVIKEITDNGLTPMVTLYHFDHPQILQDEFKGWMGEEMIDKFEEYARFVFDEYASEVKLWVTINEPNVYCTYFVLPDPQDLTKDLSKERFRCMRTNILAHAKAYRAFQDGKHKGLVGFSAHTINARPNSTSPEDVYAAEAFNQFQSGASLQPVVSGDYPQIVKDLAAGTVIPFSEEEKKLIKNTADFIGLNVYYSMVASYKHDQSDAGGEGGVPASIAPGKFGLEFLPFVSTVNDIKGDLAALYSENNPSALRTSLLWVWQSYKVPIFITENGFADIESLGLRDAPRAAYHSSYLRTLLKTIKDFNVKVLGYCAWSLIDAYEWSGVYSRRFGLVYVDYDGKLDRSLKDSKDFWIAMAENKVVPLVALSSASTQSVSLAALGAALALAWLASRSS